MNHFTREDAPDGLRAEHIQAGLTAQVFGRRVLHFQEVGSTQDEARRLAEQGAEEGTLVVAERQTKGRGRRDRDWVSPEGTGIYLSLVLRPTLPPCRVAQIPIVAGISVRRSLSEASGCPLQTKWPNDIMLQGRKVAGILAEMRAELERVYYVILGIGINVKPPDSGFPPSVKHRAVCLGEIAQGPLSRGRLVQRLLCDLEEVYVEFKRDGFEGFRDRWRQWDQTLGSWLQVEDEKGLFLGFGRDLDGDGALIVEDEKGRTRRVTAGDATVRLAASVSQVLA